jgi:hypothetical protein
VSFIAENLHLIESKDRESSVIQTGSILNSILGAHWQLFVTSAHSRATGISKDRQPSLPGNSGVAGIVGEKVNNTIKYWWLLQRVKYKISYRWSDLHQIRSYTRCQGLEARTSLKSRFISRTNVSTEKFLKLFTNRYI